MAVIIDTTGVENSDERLAAVEEAKRTGEPFRSVGSRGTEIVPTEVAEMVAEEQSKTNVYVGKNGQTYAAQLESYHTSLREGGLEFVTKTNEQKAADHEAYSAELVRRRAQEDVDNLKKMADTGDPTIFSVAVQQANFERANEHDMKSIEYAEVAAKRLEGRPTAFEVATRGAEVVNNEDLALKSNRERAEVLKGSGTAVPVADEKFAEEALIVKDNIIETSEPYLAHAMQHDQLRPKDAPANELLSSVSTPEDAKTFREETGVAQLYANNITEEATEAAQKMAEVVVEEDGEDMPDDIQEKAEARVSRRSQAKSDEMPGTPVK